MLKYERRVEAANRLGDDRALVIESNLGLTLVVTDGAGGSGAGAVAADSTINALRETDGKADLSEALAKIDRAIFAAGHGGETTVVVARVVGRKIGGASVGDSGAWLIGGAIRDLTRQQVRKPLLGSGQAQPVPFKAELNGRLLIASDGLIKYASRDKIAKWFSGPSSSMSLMHSFTRCVSHRERSTTTSPSSSPD